MILQAPGHRRFTILVAEGDPRARQALDSGLRDDGHCVIVASTGRQALDMAPGSDADLVLLDVGSSETDGLATLRALRTLGADGAGDPADRERDAPGRPRGDGPRRLGLHRQARRRSSFVMSVIQEALECTPRTAREAVCAP